MKNKNLHTLLDVAIVILIISALIDLGLWFVVAYHVPAWAISLLSVGYVLILVAVKYLIKHRPKTIAHIWDDIPLWLGKEERSKGR